MQDGRRDAVDCSPMRPLWTSIASVGPDGVIDDEEGGQKNLLSVDPSLGNIDALSHRV